METFTTLVLLYLAIGIACFAHPSDHVDPSELTWYRRLLVLLDALPAVLTWPFALWHLLRV